MKFDPPLQSATLIKRYKRFLTDIKLADGSITTIHCPNTGAMTGCAESGYTVWYSLSDNPKRKYPGTFELAQSFDNHFIGINTGNANKLVIEAINNGVIKELNNYQTVRSEVKYGDENSRIDVMLESDGQPTCFVEVKSTTLLQQGSGYFPDAVTSRGQKHIRELIRMRQQGHRSVLLFCAQHTGINKVRVADFIDLEYAKLIGEAIAEGVEILAYGCEINSFAIQISKKLQFIAP
ncbi:DNA/RNA nuclease SfsA [Thalassotalea sp. Y01]|uniref:DNA/RNA nuclease SfsA n=1 Tax=Thalassotalea sp. Y01 TaxID=2729613 RepID=UPI00145C7DB8|nr:DNA/RNA nuclease SfsA [Thalassotalea sp. Y01]NMP15679.1 DNA/RNA nuclease SfsA [Thalassotalea sp. Y01]